MSASDNLDASLDPNDMSICLSEDDKRDQKTPQNFNFVTQRSQNRQNKADSPEDIATKFDNFKEEMRKLMTYFTATQKTEIADLKATLIEIHQSNQNIESTVAHLSSQNEELKKQIISLEKNSKEDRQYIMFLEDKVEDLQGAMRKTNIEIKNVPKKSNESKQDLIEMVTCLSESLDCQMSKSDIKDIYRIRGKKAEQKNTPIITHACSKFNMFL